MPLPLLLITTALPTLQAPAPAPGGPAILEAAKAKLKAVMEARAAFMKEGGNAKDFKADCGKELAEIDARLATEKVAEVREALLVSRLFHLRLARLTPEAPLLAQVKKEVPATSAAWALEPGLLSARAEEDPKGWGAYVAEARTKHADAGVRRTLLFEHFWECLDAKDEAGWKPAFEALQKDFAGSREAKQAKDILESELKTGVGTVAPAFSLAALEDAKTTYTLDSFKGRYLLIDFWATWCGPCRAEMPSLHAAWARFKGKPFEVLSLSFDRKIEHIAPFRKQAATPMPWRHAFIEGGFQNPLSEAYGVKGIPKPLLIGPDGKIVANGGQLRGENLEKTLEKFLGK
jgi:thiol-disulfide isomerase/thioredoxin